MKDVVILKPVCKFQRFDRLHSLLLLAGISALTILAPALAEDVPSWFGFYQEGLTALSEQKPGKAEVAFRKALTLAQDKGDSGDIEKCTLKLADTLSLQNKTGEAQALYEQMIKVLRKKYGGKNAQLGPIFMELGSIQESAGDHAAAMGFYKKSLEISERNFGPYSPAVAENLQRLGREKFRTGNKQEAEQHYIRARSILLLDPNLASSERLESIVKDYGDLVKGNEDSDNDLLRDFQSYTLKKQNTNLAFSGNGQAEKLPGVKVAPAPAPGSAPPSHGAPSDTEGSAWQDLLRRQAGAEAQAVNREAPEVVSRGLNKPSSANTLAPAYKVMNDSVFGQERFAGAESNYKRKIAVDIDALGAEHPSVANDLVSLAGLYMNQQKYSAAEPLFKQALAIYEKVYGRDSLLTINTCVSLAAAKCHTGQTDEAEALYRRALAEGQVDFGPNSYETARILNEMAYLYFQQGKLQDARTFYQWALASTEATVGSESPLLAACLADYARVLRALGQTDQAAATEARAEKIIERTH